MALRTGEDEIGGDLGMAMQATLVIHELQVGRGPMGIFPVRHLITRASRGLSTVWAGDRVMEDRDEIRTWEEACQFNALRLRDLEPGAGAGWTVDGGPWPEGEIIKEYTTRAGRLTHGWWGGRMAKILSRNNLTRCRCVPGRGSRPNKQMSRSWISSWVKPNVWS